MTLTPGTLVTLTTKAVAWYPSVAKRFEIAEVVASFAGAFGATVTIRNENGDEQDVQAAHVEVL